jgi:2-polyprenyl-6-hydroxyphenyl methylase/3-demethylubiquinone-9 3-methyltransferase
MTSNGTHDPSLLPTKDAHRFAFGENWLQYVESIDERPIIQAERAVRELLRVSDLRGARFLDAGSGSGLFSLAARRLGAAVRSFDFDPSSVRATSMLRDSYFAGDREWLVEQGSVLDPGFLSRLGVFDVVYSWGVLHHTGDMWRAMGNVSGLVKPGGLLAIAIYNDQGLASRMWRLVKKTYNRLPPSWRFLVLWPAFVRLWVPTLVRDLLRGRPLDTWSRYGHERGMSPMIDVRDWVGGYPFECATPHQVIGFYQARGFALVTSVLRTGIGCSEFVFHLKSADAASTTPQPREPVS